MKEKLIFSFGYSCVLPIILRYDVYHNAEVMIRYITNAILEENQYIAKWHKTYIERELLYIQTIYIFINILILLHSLSLWSDAYFLMAVIFILCLFRYWVESVQNIFWGSLNSVLFVLI